MRFNVIERNPECYISSVRDNLENLLNAVIDRSENSYFQPMSEVRENETEYMVNVQLPGVKKEDINIWVCLESCRQLKDMLLVRRSLQDAF